jgi:hypothetical protein
MWCIENGIIPEESPIETAIGLRLPWVFIGKLAEIFRHEMLRVPELTGALVWDSPEGAMNR